MKGMQRRVANLERTAGGVGEKPLVRFMQFVDPDNEDQETLAWLNSDPSRRWYRRDGETLEAFCVRIEAELMVPGPARAIILTLGHPEDLEELTQ